MTRREYLDRYGEEPEKFHDQLEDAIDRVSSLGFGDRETAPGTLWPSRMSAFTLYMMNKELKKMGQDTSFLYGRPNSYGLRADEFIKDHSGKHILFAGCSVTFGEGLPEDYIWPRLVYNAISKTEELSGYFNISINGATHIEIMDQISQYIKDFGNPDTIFVNFPDTERMLSAHFPKDDVNRVLPRYKDLELYCSNHSIKLVSFSHYEPYNIGFPHQDIPDKDPMTEISERKTFYKFNMKDYDDRMFVLGQRPLPPVMEGYRIRALDDSHPGVDTHAFFAEHALKALK